MGMGKKKKRKGAEAPAPRGRKGGAPIIELRDVTKVYPGGHMALDRVSLAIDRGEFVFLVGPTGCGKSTLIKMLIRELSATDGSVRIAGRDIGDLPENKVRSCAATSAPSSRTSSCSRTAPSTTTSPTLCR